MNTMAQWWQSERPIAALIIVFVILGVAYSVTVPLWEAPDEVAHFGYITHLVKTHSLPVQQMGVLDEAHQPPLYYAVAALLSSIADFDDLTGVFQSNPEFIWAGQGGVAHNAAIHRTAETFPYRGIALAAHLARWVSVVTGTVTMAFTYAIARHIFPETRYLALLAAALTAFNPQFIFITGSVSLDGMAAMTCTLALWQLVRTLEQPFRWQGWALTGMWCGLAVLSKPSAFVVGLTAGGLLLLSAIRQRSWNLLWLGALALGVAFLLVGGWWFVRNWVLYGDPLGWRAFLSNWTVVQRHGKVKWNDVCRFFTTQFQSYWARFGWMTVSAPKWIYQLLLVMCGLSLLGWGTWLWRRRWRSLRESQALGLIALVLLPLLQEAFQFQSIFTFDASWYQGRYLFLSIAASSILLATGLWNLTPRWMARSVSATVGTGLFLLAITVPTWVIQPQYVTPTLARWQVWTLPHHSDATFGERIRLLGYRVERAASLDQTTVNLTLYWQAAQNPDLDYSTFVHLLNKDGELVAQHDTGLGSDQHYPTSAWRVGDIVPSQHALILPSDLPPGGYQVRVGVYFWADGSRLPVIENGIPVGDFITLDQSTIKIP
ncbi:MAG: glycosyltransferase family 39 protein [Chloroflexota bacterium]|nr:glycosyltransferase family 39 protein [Chloroflexota bacterium]